MGFGGKGWGGWMVGGCARALMGLVWFLIVGAMLCGIMRET